MRIVAEILIILALFCIHKIMVWGWTKRNILHSKYSVILSLCMVEYLCPLRASYFSINDVDMQDKDVYMQDSYVNMHHNYVDMQEVCNLIRFIKKTSISNIANKWIPTCKRPLIYDHMMNIYVDATNSCWHVT